MMFEQHQEPSRNEPKQKADVFRDLSASGLELGRPAARAALLLEQLAPEVLENLQQFLGGAAFRKEYLGYTIAFGKPMSWIGPIPVWVEPDEEKPDGSFIFPYEEEIDLGVRAWKAAGLNGSNIVLKQTPKEVAGELFYEDALLNQTFAVNRQAARAEIAANLDVFSAAIGAGSPGSADGILDGLLAAESMYEYLGRSDAALGILFGFGRSNAILWEQAYRTNTLDGFLELERYNTGEVTEDSHPFVQGLEEQLQDVELPCYMILTGRDCWRTIQLKIALLAERLQKLYNDDEFEVKLIAAALDSGKLEWPSVR